MSCHCIQVDLGRPMLTVAVGAPWAVVLCGVVFWCSLGCSTVPILPTSKTPAVVPAPDADIAAIVTVVQSVYGRAGGGRMIFLEVSAPGGEAGERSDRLRRAMTHLARSLNTRVRPESEAVRVFDGTYPIMTPIDRDTGEVGISIGIGDFAPDELGRLRVGVSYARSGLDGEVLQYVLQRTDTGWSVLEVIQVAIA